MPVRRKDLEGLPRVSVGGAVYVELEALLEYLKEREAADADVSPGVAGASPAGKGDARGRKGAE